MKKKSVRKVSASKKPTLKTKQKIKKPSLLPWLIAGLLIFATVGYWYFQAKPESIKILQIAGTVEDYISPVPVDINIVTAGRKLPMSDTPEVNAMVAANQVIRQAVKDGKAPKDVEAEAERAAVQAARDTYVQLGNTPQGQSSTTTAPTPKPTTQEIIKKANEDAAVAMSTLKNVTYTKVGDDVIAKTNSAPAGGGSGAGCPTVAGFSAGEGQTMIGDVDSDSKKDNVYRCVNGKWEDAKCDFDKENPSACPVTVKPMYLTEGKNLNCTSGGVVIGDGTVDKSAGKVCKGGVLEDAPKSGGAFKTPEEIAKLKETCLRNGGGWTDNNTCGVGKESCERGGGFWNGKICDKNRGSIAEFDCTKQGSAYKWDNSTKKCVETPKVGANTFSKQDVCEGALKDKNKESCIRSTDNPNLWMVVPKGTTTINSGVTNTTSSEINKPTTSNTTFKSGADCDRAKTQGFTCEPIAGGNYYKLTPVSQLPASREYNANAQGNFGNPSLEYPNAGKECGSQPSTKRDESGEWINPSCGQACGGLGSYLDSDGKRKCNSPGQANAEGPTRFDNPEVGKNTGIGAGAGCAAGATVGAIYGAGLGFGVFSAPVAIAGGVIGCVAGAVTGGTIGLAVTEPVSSGVITIEPNTDETTFWAKNKPVLDKENALVTDDSQCSSGKSNKFIVDNETRYYCMDDSAKYVDPITGLRITGSSCSTDSECNSGKCIKRYRFYADALAADLCE